jgi:hypothetical protein
MLLTVTAASESATLQLSMPSTAAAQRIELEKHCKFMVVAADVLVDWLARLLLSARKTLPGDHRCSTAALLCTS